MRKKKKKNRGVGNGHSNIFLGKKKQIKKKEKRVMERLQKQRKRTIVMIGGQIKSSVFLYLVRVEIFSCLYRVCQWFFFFLGGTACKI
jgi:hypothetical protein